MKIISLVAENIKKITTVEISPNGNLVQITGKNGQGKTSVLDSIWWALGGLSAAQGKPIREGETSARIKIDLGEIVVTRKFTEKSSTLTVENAEGVAIKSPQSMLDGLLGSLTFDPLAFSRMTSKQQFDELRKFVVGVDFDKMDMENKQDYDERTIINRQIKAIEAQIDSIVVTSQESEDDKTEQELIDMLGAAAKHNSDIETRKRNRETMAKGINDKKARIDKIDEEIRKLEEERNNLGLEIVATETKLANAGQLAAPVDISDLQKRIAAKQANREAESKAKRRAQLVEDNKKLTVEADKLTDRMIKRAEAKADAISKSNLPLKGLGFGDGVVLLNGVPFNQASDAEQLRASISIAMASNSKLRVIRVRDGSLLDEDSMKILEQMAKDKDYQVWLERVDSSGKVGIVMEDGHVKGQVTEQEKKEFAEDVKHDRKPTIDIEENGAITEKPAPRKIKNYADDIVKQAAAQTQSDEDLI